MLQDLACNMSFDFTGKKILVTGAGRGIGRGIAIALAQSGCKVYALSRTQSSLDSLKAEHPIITAIAQDVAQWDKTREKLRKLEPLDGLVNNAGILDFCASTDVSYASLNQILHNNLLSAINCTQVVGTRMIEARKGGSIVNMSSVASLTAIPGMLAYGIAKAGMDRATQQFALELGPHNIRVNSVSPSIVPTDMLKDIIESGGHLHTLERTPCSRLVEIEDVVNPVLYLLSDLSAMVSGTTHIIDGGLLCHIAPKCG